MSPADREMVTRSLANLWIWQTAFTARLLEALRENGMPPEALERLLQALDQDTDALEGVDDQAFATGLLAVARSRLSLDSGRAADPGEG